MKGGLIFFEVLGRLSSCSIRAEKTGLQCDTPQTLNILSCKGGNIGFGNIQRILYRRYTRNYSW